MASIKKYAVLLLVVFLVGCMPSPEDVVSLEGDPGQGGAGAGSENIADILTPSEENRLKKNFSLESGAELKGVGPVEYMLKFIQDKLDGVVEEIFEALNEDGGIDALLQYSFILVIVIYGISLTAGLVDSSPYTLVMTIFKIMVVFSLATNYEFFSSFVKDTVEGAGKELTNIISKAFSDGTTELYFLDDVISVVISFKMMKFLYALFLPSTGVGWLYGVIMVAFIWFFVSALLQAVYLLVVSMIIRSVLFALAPIFLCGIMFQSTKKYFDGWVKQVINFTLLPVFLFAFFGFFYGILIFFMQELSATPLGQTPVPVSYATGPKMPGNMVEWFVVVLGAPGQIKYGLDEQMPINLAPILSLLVISYTLRQMTDWAVSLSGHITQQFTSFSISSAAPGNLARQLKQETQRVVSTATKAVSTARDKIG